jgi:sterol desaturase/sphingolipid hydroxylase (fatty acid hydroxylase superfamily)
VVVLDVLHDTWFYWTHRLLHWRPLYRWVHWEHHRCGAWRRFAFQLAATATDARSLTGTSPHPTPRSTAPSAFTGYAFHVAEAALVFANEVLVCFLFPLHIALHRLYHILTTVIHQGGMGGVS